MHLLIFKHLRPVQDTLCEIQWTRKREKFLQTWQLFEDTESWINIIEVESFNIWFRIVGIICLLCAVSSASVIVSSVCTSCHIRAIYHSSITFYGAVPI